MRLLVAASALALLASPTAAREPRSSDQAKNWVRDAKLKSFECGDNCWLRIEDAKGRSDSVLCNALLCEMWVRAGRLPRALKGKRARLTLRMGKAMSGDQVMADSPEVIRIEVLK